MYGSALQYNPVFLTITQNFLLIISTYMVFTEVPKQVIRTGIDLKCWHLEITNVWPKFTGTNWVVV